MKDISDQFAKWRYSNLEAEPTESWLGDPYKSDRPDLVSEYLYDGLS